MTKRIAFITLGCKLNYAETSTYERGLVKAGCEAVSWTETGIDLFLVNTCSVTEHSDKKSRNIIRKLHRTVPQAAIVVTGCSAQLRREAIEAIDGVAKVFGAAQKNEVVPYCLALLGLETAKSGVAGGLQDKAGQQDAEAGGQEAAGRQAAARSCVLLLKISLFFSLSCFLLRKTAVIYLIIILYIIGTMLSTSEIHNNQSAFL